ncbi:MAG: hypothetical protein FWB80_07920, partial [Defluviitaleaceae bacterium]|nr:hypothetical protein [Defluviitaleaceae bacterium]
MKINQNTHAMPSMFVIPPPVVPVNGEFSEEDLAPFELELSDEAKQLVRASMRNNGVVQDMSHMSAKLRQQAEQNREQMEAQGEHNNNLNIAMKIASRIANGDNVPQRDRAFLIEHSPGMYMKANNMRMMRENNDPRDYDSLLPDDHSPGEIAAQAMSSALGASGGRGG